MTTSPSSACMLPWVSLETSPVGSARPCCLALDEITDASGRRYDLTQDSVIEIYSSDYMVDLRQQFRQGLRPKTCQRCWDEEAAGRTSKRMNTALKFKEEIKQVDWNNDRPNQLWFLDLKLGNICNLSCRICGSWSSSAWAPEEMASADDPKQHSAYLWSKAGRWPRTSEVFWQDLDVLLPQIQYFEFTGGEPFLISEHFDLLSRAVLQGHAKHIDIHYNTNGTVFPRKFTHLWQNFRSVEIAFSVDDVGARFEYQRNGASWDQVQANIKKFQIMRDQTANMSLQICMTVNVQNVFYLNELCDWAIGQEFDHHHFNMLHDPRHQNIGTMTAAAKALVTDKLSRAMFTVSHRREIDRLLEFMNQGPSSDGSVFCAEMQRSDRFRGQDFRDHHAEIAEAMGYGPSS